MKKLLAILFAAFLLLTTAACSDGDDSGSDDTEDEESSGSASEPAEEEDEEDEEDESSGSASEPADDEDEDEEPSGSASEPADDLPRGMDDAVESFDEQFDLTDDEEDCLVDAVLDDPDLLELDESEIETDPEAFNLVFGLLRDCVGDERLAEALAAEMADAGLDEAQTQCVAAEFVELDEALWAELILGSNDPTYVPSSEVQAAIVDMFTTCGIDPTTLN